MKHATEYFAVQNALGIDVDSISESVFKAADEQHKDRISTIDFRGIYSVWVDGKCVVMEKQGHVFTPTEAQSDQLFKAFWESPVI